MTKHSSLDMNHYRKVWTDGKIPYFGKWRLTYDVVYADGGLMPAERLAHKHLCCCQVCTSKVGFKCWLNLLDIKGKWGLISIKESKTRNIKHVHTCIIVVLNCKDWCKLKSLSIIALNIYVVLYIHTYVHTYIMVHMYTYLASICFACSN